MNTIRERVDQHAVGVGGDLDEAQPGVIGALAHELRVDRKTRRSAHAEHRCGELFGGRYERGVAHWRSGLRVESWATPHPRARSCSSRRSRRDRSSHPRPRSSGRAR